MKRKRLRKRNLTLSSAVSTMLPLLLRTEKPNLLSLLLMLIQLTWFFGCHISAEARTFLTALSSQRLSWVNLLVLRRPVVWPSLMSSQRIKRLLRLFKLSANRITISIRSKISRLEIWFLDIRLRPKSNNSSIRRKRRLLRRTKILRINEITKLSI